MNIEINISNLTISIHTDGDGNKQLEALKDLISESGKQVISTQGIPKESPKKPKKKPQEKIEPVPIDKPSKSKKPDKGKRIKLHNSIPMYKNVVNDLRGAKTKDQKDKIFDYYFSNLSDVSLRKYKSAYNSFIIKEYPPLTEVAKKHIKKMSLSPGRVIALRGGHKIHQNIYQSVLSLKRKGKLTPKNTKDIIKKFYPNGSKHTHATYASAYRNFILEEYDPPTEKEKRQVLTAISDIFRNNKESSIKNISEYSKISLPRLRNILKVLTKERKVKKEKENYHLRYTV